MLSETQFRRSIISSLIMFLFSGVVVCSVACGNTTLHEHPPSEVNIAKVTSLPQPRTEGSLSLEETLKLRRSVRAFSTEALSLDEISQLLWAAQGITDPYGFRTAPSAGALYPLELYILTKEGVFHYDVRNHALVTVIEGDIRHDLYTVSLKQDAILQAPLTVVITAVYSRTEVKYGSARTPRYVHLEAGHAAQNLLLQAVSLSLGGVPIGAFEDDRVQAVLSLPADHKPLYLIPIGHPR